MNSSIVGILISVLVVGILYFLPTLAIKFRAKRHGLSLNNTEVQIIKNCNCAHTAFFQGVSEIRKYKNISIMDLATHYLASGSLNNLIGGLEELNKQGKEADFATLKTMDLIDKDLKSEIASSDNILSIEISSLGNSNFKLDYQLSYKYDFPESAFRDKNKALIIDKIKTKLETFFRTWGNESVEHTELFLRENILPIEFFERYFGIVIIEQKYVWKL